MFEPSMDGVWRMDQITWKKRERSRVRKRDCGTSKGQRDHRIKDAVDPAPERGVYRFEAQCPRGFEGLVFDLVEESQNGRASRVYGEPCLRYHGDGPWWKVVLNVGHWWSPFPSCIASVMRISVGPLRPCFSVTRTLLATVP